MITPTRLLLAGAAALAIGAPPALSEEQFLIDTAGDLATLCLTQSSDPNFAAAIHMCHGFIIGAHHMHEAFEAGWGGQGQGVYCVPETGAPSRNEVATEFATWVRQTPAAASGEAIDALMEWAVVRFPCP